MDRRGAVLKDTRPCVAQCVLAEQHVDHCRDQERDSHAQLVGTTPAPDAEPVLRDDAHPGAERGEGHGDAGGVMERGCRAEAVARLDAQRCRVHRQASEQRLLAYEDGFGGPSVPDVCTITATSFAPHDTFGTGARSNLGSS